MNAERLLQLYDRVADAPDAVPRLRRLVLDLAVRGTLVEQDPGDEPASELLKRIGAEQARLLKAKEIRKPKARPPNAPDLWPFALPHGWTWARIDELSPRSLTDGDWIETKDQSADGGIRLTQLADVGVGIFLNKSSRFITAETEVRLNCTRLVVGDVLIARLPNPIGRACIFPEIGQPAITAVDVAILRLDGNVSAEYVVHAMNSPPTRNQIEAYGKGATRFRVSTGHLKTVLIPLPPLAEQHRIVAKVDELMALCDRLEEARTTRETTRDHLTAASLARLSAPNTDAGTFPTHARFALDALPTLTTRPDQIKALRQTILNLAVRGKLVEQDPADEPASELLKRLRTAQKNAFAEEGLRKRKPVKRLERGEIPFDFPESWELPNFDDLFVIVSGVTKGGRVPTETAVELPYLRVANVQRGYLDLAVIKRIVVKKSDQERYGLKSGDILMTEGGDWDKLGRAAIWRNEIADCIHQNHIFRVRPSSQAILPEWAVVYVNSELGRRFFEDASKQTTNLASINMTQLRGCPIPLPPLAEQHRIVAKVDELMALCGRLEAALATADTTRARLLGALLHEALTTAPRSLTEAAA